MRRLFFTLEGWLAISVAALILQLAWPATENWWNRPYPGRQVALQSDQLRYLLYLPRDYSSKASWPLLIFLHGRGQQGYDHDTGRAVGPAKCIEEGEHFPFIVVSPQAPGGRSWRPETVRQLIDDLSSRYNVDRCYLTGLSMGGYGVWRTAAAMPDRFAAVAPLCGGGDPRWAEKLTELPIWAFHGENDKIVPLEQQQKIVDAVNRAGGNAKLTVYPKAGHGIARKTYANPELYEWFLSHR